MLSNYYEALELNKNADKNQINEAFRKLSLKWHPDNKNNQDKKIAYNKFCEICEAFEVLSDEQKKGIYDTYGVFKLKNGFDQNGMLIGGYEFQGNPEDIFEKFFGTTEFYAALVQFENEFANYLNEQNDFIRSPPKNIYVEKDITLLDLYTGKTIQVDFDRQITNQDGITTKVIKAQKDIVVPKGFDVQKQICFQKEGNELPGFENCNLKSQFDSKIEINLTLKILKKRRGYFLCSLNYFIRCIVKQTILDKVNRQQRNIGTYK